MAYRYKLTPLAMADVDEALDYIDRRLANPAAAKKLYLSLLKEVESVCSGPFSYPNCSCYLIEDNSIRHAVVGNYVLIFSVDEKDRLVKFLRFLYGRRDINDSTIRHQS